MSEHHWCCPEKLRSLESLIHFLVFLVLNFTVVVEMDVKSNPTSVLCCVYYFSHSHISPFNNSKGKNVFFLAIRNLSWHEISITFLFFYHPLLHRWPPGLLKLYSFFFCTATTKCVLVVYAALHCFIISDSFWEKPAQLFCCWFFQVSTLHFNSFCTLTRALPFFKLSASRLWPPSSPGCGVAPQGR